MENGFNGGWALFFLFIFYALFALCYKRDKYAKVNEKKKLEGEVAALTAQRDELVKQQKQAQQQGGAPQQAAPQKKKPWWKRMW